MTTTIRRYNNNNSRNFLADVSGPNRVLLPYIAYTFSRVVFLTFSIPYDIISYYQKWAILDYPLRFNRLLCFKNQNQLITL